jgi:para-aminobenzoate synthetase component II
MRLAAGPWGIPETGWGMPETVWAGCATGLLPRRAFKSILGRLSAISSSPANLKQVRRIGGETCPRVVERRACRQAGILESRRFYLGNSARGLQLAPGRQLTRAVSGSLPGTVPFLRRPPANCCWQPGSLRALLVDEMFSGARVRRQQQRSLPVLLVDHDDSFTFNLVGCLQRLGANCAVISSERVAQACDTEMFGGVILSPGPCAPDPHGASAELVRTTRVPLLGVCLGMQTISVAFGGRLRRVEPVHGKTSPVFHDRRGLFGNLPQPFLAMRYHSLAIDEASLPGNLSITARTAGGVPMALRDAERGIDGIQFHPESIGSEQGLELLENWLCAL